MSRPARPPVRAAHLGLGAFHRSHQAWYTARANEGAHEPWGIAAFTGRRPDAALAMAAQDCRYTLVTRSADGDAEEVIDTIVEAHDGGDATAWRDTMSHVAVLTVTVTEPGYSLDEGGLLAEAAILKEGELPRSPLGRILDGLVARRAAGGGPLAVVACDNLDGNGALLESGVRALAARVDSELEGWVSENVSFVSSVVDRITPAIPASELDAVIDGRPDHCAVVAEPVTSWYISGDFPAGRPEWERGGAVFVEDTGPYEKRKLWLLNAAHTALALRGLLLGHESVADAMDDPVCVDLVERLWDEAADVLPFTEEEVAAERERLASRFRNPRIRHHLAQIAQSSGIKLGVRIGAVIEERRAHRLAVGSGQLDAVAAWAVAVESGLVPGESTSDAGELAREFLARFVPDDEKASEALAVRVDALRAVVAP